MPQLNIKQVSVDKGLVCEKILRALPDWFGIESAILDYITDVGSMPFWVAEQSGKVVGFTAVNMHFPNAAEIHVMGVLPAYHRQGIGKKMIEATEIQLRKENVLYLQVKTLSPSRENEEYALTRKFYLAQGFTPLEEFPTLWGEANPALMLIKYLN